MPDFDVSNPVDVSIVMGPIDNRIEFPSRSHLAEFAGMTEHFNDWFGPCDSRRMMSAVHIYRAFAGLDVSFDNRRLLAEGMQAPPRLTD